MTRSHRFSTVPSVRLPGVLKALTIPKARYEVFEGEEDDTTSGEHEMSEISIDYSLPLNYARPPLSPLAQQFEQNDTSNSGNFVRTMRYISLESRRKRSADNYETFFFTDKKCMDRAAFMAARLKQSFSTIFADIELDNYRHPYSSFYSNPQSPTRGTYIPPPPIPTPSVSSDRRGRGASPIPTTSPRIHPIDPPAAALDVNLPLTLAKHIASRLYTLNFLFFLLPHTPARANFIQQLQDSMSRMGDPALRDKRGGLESHFAVRWALDEVFSGSLLSNHKSKIVERAREVLERCLESEEKLSMSEKECMYIFHGLMSGVDWEKEGCWRIVGVPLELSEEMSKIQVGVVEGVQVPGGIDDGAFFEAVVGAQRV
ncbi:hypothetical protein BC937DRAFT_94205 [Endogone sp. FLAS-F59071]|nr:hypothetical protein BC937DRAFT_94205 [Endogone sp. FLAS-F59071]|eukprot:RUS14199.1 hypothetical protein BC937DRAFT_94205 [Endogone sp. FLAS-F59071]